MCLLAGRLVSVQYVHKIVHHKAVGSAVLHAHVQKKIALYALLAVHVLPGCTATRYKCMDSTHTLAISTHIVCLVITRAPDSR